MDTVTKKNGKLQQIYSKEQVMDFLEQIFDRPQLTEKDISTLKGVSFAGRVTVDLKRDEHQWSPELYEFLEANPETVRPGYESFLSFVLKEDRQELKSRMMENNDGLENDGYSVYRVKTGSGTLKTLIGIPKVTYNSADEAEQLSVSIYDVSRLNQKDKKKYHSVNGNTMDLSSRWLNQIFENKVAGIFILNEKGQFLRSNTYYQELTGYSKAELKQLTFLDLTPANEWDVCKGKIAGLLKGEYDSFTMEKQLLTRSKKLRWVEVNCTAVRQEKTHVLCFLTDIHEKKLTRENLTISEEQLHQAQEIAKIGSWGMDLKTGEITWSKGMYDIMEMPYTYMPTVDTAIKLIHPEDQSLFQEKIAGNEVVFNLEIRHVTKSGVKHVLINSRLEVDENGTPVRYHGTSQDISERRFSDTRLQLVQDTAKLGWWESNLLNEEEDDIWSDSLYDLLELDKNTTRPCFESFLKTVHPEEQHLVLNTMGDPECLRNGWQNKVDRILKKDGTFKYLMSSGHFVWDGDRPVKLLGTMMDVSNVKEMEMKLQEAQEIARMGWWEINLLTRKTEWSSAIYDMMEMDSSEEPLAFKEYVEHVHPEDRSFLYTDPKDLKDGWRNVQLRYKRKSGGYTHTLGSGRVIFDGDVPVKMIGTSMDVTSLVETRLKLEEAEKTAKQSQELLESINQNISEGIYRSDIGGLIYANNAFVKIFGYDSAEDMLGIKASRLYKNPEDRDRLVQLLRENAHYENEKITFIKKDGTEFIALASCTATKDTSGQLFWDGAIRDVTSLLRIQKKLEEAQKIAKLGWWEFDLTGENNHWFSQDHMNILEISSPEEIITMEDFYEFVHPEDLEYVKKTHEQGFADKEWHNMVHRIITKSGKVKYITSSATFEYAGQEPVRIFGSVYDITDIKEIEHKLAKNLVNMEAMVNSMENMVFVIDDQLVFREVFCNTPEKLMLEPHEYIGKKVSSVWKSNKNADGLVARKCEKALQNKSVEPIDFKQEVGERAYWWEATFKTFPDQDGKRWLAVIVNDITTRKNAEEELMRTVRKERELSEMSNQFVSMASHQFRTPLTVIKSNMQLLELSGLKDPIINKVTKRLDSEVDRLVSLMEDIMAMGKVQAHSVQTNFQPINLRSLINKIKQEVERKQKDDRLLKVKISGEERPVKLDEQFIEHALHNLIDNAFKYSVDAPGPEVKVVFEAKEVTISVIDKGIGIPEEDRSRLFNTFQRGSNSQHIQGTGLGLAVAREFIRLNEGSISLNAERETGTEFCVALPIKE